MPKSLRRPSGWIALSALAVMALAMVSSSPAPANTPALPAGAIVPTDGQRAVARRVGTILEEAHFRRAPIDDKMSAQVYDRYLDLLDPQRSYFLASDIADFSGSRLKFDDMIRTGDLEPGYVIFARFQQRNRDRIQYALNLLKTEPDWTVNESFEFDREHTAWPATANDMNELWRKRVKNDALSLILTGKNWKDASDILQKRYERVLKRVDQVTPEDVFENLMNAYARTFDPHSSYFSPRSSEEYRIQMSLNYEGIGASLQLVDDYVTILSIIEGGPASTAGTLVRLQVLPAGAAPGSTEKTLEFVRNKVTLEAQAAHKEVKNVTRNGKTLKVGVITVPGFYSDITAQAAGDENYRSTTRDVRKLIEELKTEKIDGLVLDLRDDGGGYLPEATALTGLFIDKGPVVQLKDTTGRLEVLDDPEPGTSYDGPLAVLVNRTSASASEIFAGAIQDYRRGVVIGQRTFGKGTVQNLVPLDRWSQRPVNGQLTVTIGKFYRVTGESTQHRGVEPDVPLPSPIDMKEVGESALDSALPWDRIAGVPFRTDQREETPIPALSTEEGQRAQKDPDYRWLVASIAANDTLREQKSISLNLATRKQERTEQDAERLARENSRRTAKGEPAVKTPEELEKADEPDIVLAQAAEIMGDMVTGARPAIPVDANGPKTVRRN